MNPNRTVLDDGVVDLSQAGADLLDQARSAPAGRAALTLAPGAGAPLKQTLMALTAGTVLADHESPGAATLQVLTGQVQLTAGDQVTLMTPGRHAPIPPMRHGLTAVDDAVVLITVAATAD